MLQGKPKAKSTLLSLWKRIVQLIWLTSAIEGIYLVGLGSHLYLRVPRAKHLRLPIVLCLGYRVCPKAKTNNLKYAEASMCNCLPLPYANHRDVTSSFFERVILIACRWPSSSSGTEKTLQGNLHGDFGCLASVQLFQHFLRPADS